MSSSSRRRRSKAIELNPKRQHKATRLRAARSIRFGLESLEDRVLLSGYVVNSTAYNPLTAGTLAYEIQAAITAHDTDAQISFNLPDDSTITLDSTNKSSTTTYGATAYLISGSGVSITIDGSGAPGLTIDGGDAVRPFAVESGSSLTLENLTVTNGKAVGGTGGSSGKGGGGGGGAGLGGAIYDDGGTFTAEGVTFTNNAATGGAGGASLQGSSGYGGGGGGIGATAAGHSGAAGGAGEGAGGHGSTGIYRSSKAGGFGGGGGGSYSNNDYGPGSGGFGGGGGGGADGSYGHGGFAGGAGGSAPGYTHGQGGGGGGGLGGGVFSNGGSITLINDTFTGDSATGGAGGAGVHTGSAGQGFGGAVFIRNSTLWALYDTFSSNIVANGDGSGHLVGSDTYILGDGNGTAYQATLINDILGQSGSSTVSDFASGTEDGGTLPDLSASSHDLVTLNAGLGGLPAGAIVATGDPMLGALASNGGPTQTMALQAGSPAIGAGVARADVTVDQAGNTRPDPPAIGASEQVISGPSVSASVTSLTLASTTAGTPGAPSSFTVGGTGLTADIIVTAPAGAELSTDGTTWHATLDLPESGGSVASTAISARVAASATAGPLSGDITIASSGATTQDVAVSGTVAAGTATYTVTDGSDAAGSASDVTFRYAIAQAVAAGGTAIIDFSSTPTNIVNNTITLSTSDSSALNVYGPTAFVIDNSSEITIDGSGDPGLILSGGGTLRLFAIQGGSSLVLHNLTITAGLAKGGDGGSSGDGGGGGGGAGLGGGIYDDGGEFEADGVTFTNNIALGGAGGSSASTPGYAGGGGGGLGTPGGNGGTIFATVGGAGGGAGGQGGKAGTVTAQPGHSGGFGGGGGGGGYNDSGAGGDGGGGGFGGGGGGGGGNLFYNYGSGGGGGFGAGNGGNGSNQVNSQGGPGGGGSGGAALGGGIFSNGGSVTLVDDTFTDNSATGGAGGSAATSDKEGTAGDGYGGAVFVRNGTLTATFTTFSADTIADGDGTNAAGSEVYILGDGAGVVPQATLIDDILGQSGSSTVSDFASGAVNGGVLPDLSASSHDLVTNNASSGGLPGAAVVATGDPMLGALASNGGPTQTMAPQFGSPAIGAGVAANYPGTSNAITTDQSGATIGNVINLGALQAVAQAPSVTASVPQLALGAANPGSAGSGQSFTVGGSGLTGAVNLSAPAGVELSDDGGFTWNSEINLLPTNGTLAPTAVEARISSSAANGPVSGTVTIDSPGTTAQSVPVSGSVNASPSPTVTSTVSSLPLVSSNPGVAGSAQSFLVGGSDLTGDLTVSAPAGIELSDDGGLTWHSSLDLPETNGTVDPTAVETRISASAPAGAMTGSVTISSPGAATESIPVGGTANASPSPVLTSTVSALPLGLSNPGVAGSAQSFTVGGSGLTGDITVSAPTGAEISDDGGLTWHSSLDLPETNGTVTPTAIQARISASAVNGPMWGPLTIASPGAATQDLPVSGTINVWTSPVVTSTVGSLPLGSSNPGNPGSTQTFTVGGTSLVGPMTITAPAGVELSDDGGLTWHPSLSLPDTNYAVAPTAVEARISASAAAGTISGAITIASMAAPTQTIPVSGTANASPSPVVTSTASSLDLGSANPGSAGSAQSFKAGGTGLTGDMTISAPAGVELSDDGGLTWDSSLDLPETNGTVDPTVIQARISASAPAGAVSGNVTIASPGATTQDLPVSGTANASASPAVATSVGSLDLGSSNPGSAGSAQTFTVGGTGLTGDMTVTAPAGVELSDDGGLTWHSSLDLPEVAGAVTPIAVEARISPSAPAGAIGGDITIASPGATTQSIPVSGTASASASPAINSSVSSLALGSSNPGNAGSAQTFVVGATGLATDMTVTAPAGIELSDDGGLTWNSSLDLPETNGTVAPTTVQARISASAPAGAISGTIAITSPGVTGQAITISGTANASAVPVVTSTVSSLALASTTAGVAGAASSFAVAGSGLPGDILVTAPTGVELSDDGGLTWNSSLDLPETGGTVGATTIEARFAAGAAAGTVSGSIFITDPTGISTQNVAVSGVVVARPTVTSTAGSLALGSSNPSAAGSAQAVTVGGTSLVGPMTVTAPASVELSDDGGLTWHSSLDLPEVNGSVNPTAIQARISASAPVGTISGNVTITSPGATTQDLPVTGTADASTSPQVTSTVGSLALGSANPGVAGAAQSFTVGGTGLTGDMTVTVPAGVELSDDGGLTWHSSLDLPETNGIVAPTTVQARVSDSAPAGGISGSIAIASPGASTQDIPVSGMANASASPVVTTTVGSLALGSANPGVAGSAQSFTAGGTGLIGDMTVTAPAGIELSDDGGLTWHSSLDLPEVGGTVAPTTVSTRISPSAPAGAVSGSVTIASPGATTQSIPVSGIANASATPTVTTTAGSLALGTANPGSAGSAQTFSAGGTGLTGDMTVTAPAGVEVSDDGGLTWHSSLDLPEVDGTVAPTTVSTRISPSAPAGAVSGSVTIASPGATTQSIPVSGTANASPSPTVTTTAGSLALGSANPGVAGSAQSFTAGGSGLTGDMTVTAPAGVELSDDGGLTWHSSLDLPEVGGAVAPTTVSTRISPSAPAGTVSGSVTIASPGATTQSIPVSGTASSVASPTVTSTASSLSLGSANPGSAGSARSFTVSGSGLTGDMTVSAPAGVELSDDGGLTWHSSLDLPEVGGTVARTIVQARVSASAPAGVVSGSIVVSSPGASGRDVIVSGTANASAAPIVTSTAGSIPFGSSNPGVAGTAQTFDVGGTGLGGNMTVTAPAGVELSDDGGLTWHSSLDLPESGGTVAQTAVEARISASAPAGGISGGVTIASPGAATQSIPVSGTANASPSPVVTTTVGSLALGSSNPSDAGSGQSFTVGGTGLSGAMTVTAPTGVELSDDGGLTWHSSLDLPQTSGTVAPTTVEARISGTAPAGGISGSIAVTSPGAATQDIPVSGTANASTSPVVTSTASSVALGSSNPGDAGSAQTFTVGGTGLTGDLTVAAPTDVELSDDGGLTWHSSLDLPQTSGTVAPTTVEARISGTAPAGGISGSISITSPGATSQSIPVSGTANASSAPVVTTTLGSIALGSSNPDDSGSAQTFDVGGTGLTGGMTVTAPAGVELSDDGGLTWQPTLSLPSADGTVVSTPVEARISPSAPAGAVSGTVTVASPGAATQSIPVSGTANASPAPVVTTTVGSLPLGSSNPGDAGSAQTFTVGGTGLTSSMTVTAPTGVELSDDGGLMWQPTLSLPSVNGTVVSTPVEVRISPSAPAGAVSGTVTITSPGATEQTIPVSGTANASPAPVVSTTVGSLPLGSSNPGTAGSGQSFTVGGTGLTEDMTVTAPAGVELSDDGGLTWHTSLDLPEAGGTVAPTAVEARISASAPAGGISGGVTIASPGAVTQSIPASGTANASPSPVVTTTVGSIPLGSSNPGDAGSAQSFTVGGTGLTGDMTVTAPAGVELSDDGGLTWHSSLDLPEAGDTVNPTAVEARISSSAPAGVVSGTVTIASPGAMEQSIPVSGAANASPSPVVTTTVGSVPLGSSNPGIVGSAQTFTVGGTGLTGDMTVTAPAGVELSDDGGLTWHSSLDLPEADGTVAPTTLEVRISGSAPAGAISGSIRVASPGADTQILPVGGTANASPSPVVTSTTSSLPLMPTTAGSASAGTSFIVGGTGLAGDVMVTAPGGVELSDDGGVTWYTSLDLPEVDGTVATTMVESRISASAPVGVISGFIEIASADAATREIAVSGTVAVPPTISPSVGTLALAPATAGTPGTASSFTVGGTGLTADMILTAPVGIELSDDGGATWHTSLDLPETGGIVPGVAIEVRIGASAPAGTVSGDIVITSAGANTENITVAGTAKSSAEAGTIVASLADAFYGETVTLTATFEATAVGSMPMSGTVAFYDGTVYLGTAPLIATGDPSGTASLSISSLAVGNDPITAVYSGDANYSGASTGTPAVVMVNPATTATTLTSATTAQGTVLTADVVVTSPSNPPIAGTVSFFDGTTLLGTVPVSDGIASLNIGTLSAGSHSFSANFSGSVTTSTSGSTLVVAVASPDGPQVTSVQRYGFHDQSTFLVINFNSALALAEAENATNYTIVGPAGRRIKVTSAIYDAATHTVMLKPSGRLNIHRSYRLTVNGTSDPGLTNLSGTLLDGAGNGQPGSNYVTSLTWRNLAGRANQRPTLAVADAPVEGGLVVRVKRALHKHTK
jgi:Bacterial Ig-like domain (group 3)